MTTHRTRSHSRIHSNLLLISIMALAIASFAGDAFAQGQGKGGGGGGGGGGSPPAPAADPAIAFTTGSGALAVINDDGSNLTTIATGLPASGEAVSWSPDLDGDSTNGYQGMIAFVRSSSVPFYSNVWLGDVRVVNGVPTMLRQRVIASDAAFLYGLSLSPDLDPDTPGYQGILAYARWTSDMDVEIGGIAVEWNGDAADPSTVDAPLADPVFSDTVNHPLVFYPAWSADGTRIAFASRRPSPVYDLYVIDDLSDPQPRLLVAAEDIGGSPYDPEWARTSDTIIVRTTSTGAVWTVDADDYTLTYIGVGGAHSPTWAPDDSAIAYAIPASPGNTLKIFRRDLHTGTVTLLAGHNKVHYRYPKWRPF